MTDAAVADIINRRTAEAVAERLDALDIKWSNDAPWYTALMSDTFMGANAATDGDRAWFFAILANNTPGVDFADDAPADADWENLFSHFRGEIVGRRISQAAAEGHAARRDPQPPHVQPVATQPCDVV